ncbi:MAG: hypothetical protein AAFR21_16850 [Pseudomonadota bacterium]
MRIFPEYALDDFGLFGDDFTLARNWLSIRTKLLDHSVAIGQPCCHFTSFNAPLLSAQDLGFHFLKIELVHKTFDANIHGPDIPFGQGDNLNAKKLQTLVQMSRIALIAR